jgi:CheY-like chemotaxis protein
MKQAGGTARIESAVGIGTTVYLYLSVVDDPVQQSEPEENTLFDGMGGLTVLVIDDDAGVRQFIEDCLDMLGYPVLQANDGYAGIAAFDRSNPDVVIVDFAMPGLNGAEVARQIRTRSHDVPIIFVTGYSDTSAIEAVAGVDASVLRKPFGIEEFEEALKTALGSLGKKTDY